MFRSCLCKNWAKLNVGGPTGCSDLISDCDHDDCKTVRNVCRKKCYKLQSSKAMWDCCDWLVWSNRPRQWREKETGGETKSRSQKPKQIWGGLEVEVNSSPSLMLPAWTMDAVWLLLFARLLHFHVLICCLLLLLCVILALMERSPALGPRLVMLAVKCAWHKWCEQVWFCLLPETKVILQGVLLSSN